MPPAAFKDLCLDATDPRRSASFWGPALGLRADPRDDLVALSGDKPEHRVWINPVPEPQTVKQRVHIDVNVAAVADLTALGATVLDDTLPWTLMADPEGGELCAFIRSPDDLGDYRLYEVVVDAADYLSIARWWADRFGVEAHDEPEHAFAWIDDAPGLPFELIFGFVPEPKTAKNRVHWDVWGDPEDFLAAGATLLRARDDQIEWDVLADPEGNEFCVFRPAPEAG
ncbi:MAG TPA: VOC family protein [Propionibacteriaceae bacterium]